MSRRRFERFDSRCFRISEVQLALRAEFHVLRLEARRFSASGRQGIGEMYNSMQQPHGHSNPTPVCNGFFKVFYVQSPQTGSKQHPGSFLFASSRPHFNWVVGTCESNAHIPNATFCDGIPPCARAPQINYAAAPGRSGGREDGRSGGAEMGDVRTRKDETLEILFGRGEKTSKTWYWTDFFWSKNIRRTASEKNLEGHGTDRLVVFGSVSVVRAGACGSVGALWWAGWWVGARCEAYQYNGSHFVLQDASTAGDLSDAGVAGSFKDKTGWEKVKSKFRWEGGEGAALALGRKARPGVLGCLGCLVRSAFFVLFNSLGSFLRKLCVRPQEVQTLLHCIHDRGNPEVPMTHFSPG